MIRGFTQAISQGKEISVQLLHGGSCPSCSAQIKPCPRCGQLARVGNYCCSEYIS